jgi:hypothetical protein
MRKRITRIAPIQLGKVFAVLYALFSIPIVLIMLAAASFGDGAQAMPMAMVLAIPVIYVVFGFIFTAIAGWIYNVVAKWTGGVEYEAMEVSDA